MARFRLVVRSRSQHGLADGLLIGVVSCRGSNDTLSDSVGDKVVCPIHTTLTQCFPTGLSWVLLVFCSERCAAHPNPPVTLQEAVSNPSPFL